MNRAKKVCLLNPGPVTLTGRVRQSLLGPDLCHREPEFAALQADVRDRLVRVYPGTESEYTTVLLTGSGTAAVEAMVGSLVPRGGKVLVVENGVYGERISSMLRAQGKNLVTVCSAWTEPPDLAEVERKLASNPGIHHVVAVHHETTTGRLNDLAALGALCRRRRVPLLLDAVSSFGGEWIDLKGWNVEGCASTANKCLHGVPGIAFVLVRQAVFEDRPSGACSLYLDLWRNYEEQRNGYPLFTPAVQVLYALREALAELEEQGGWEQRQLHYRELSQALRTGLRQRGIPLLLDESCYSAALSSFVLPEGVSFQHLYERLRRSDFVIYPGQHWLKETIFRTAVLGDLSREDIEDFLVSFSAAIHDVGAPRGIQPNQTTPAPAGGDDT
jgi:2-aminoethylphosphonate-pyruvate transaminase